MKNTLTVTMMYVHLEDGAPGCTFWKKGDRIRGVIQGGRFHHYLSDGGEWSVPLSEVADVIVPRRRGKPSTAARNAR
jgi:hypothetical protein